MIRNNKLEIFENFEIDYKLPKFNKSEKVDLVGSIPSNLVNGNNGTVVLSNSGSVIVTDRTATTMGMNWGTVNVPSNPAWGGVDENNVVKPRTWFGKILAKFEKKKEEKRKTMTILNFFSSLAQSLNDLTVLQDTAIHYEAAIANAAKAGQTALVEQYKGRLASAVSELQLVNIGLTKYFTEEQIVDFYKKADRDRKLKLTWIKNFIKPIPSDILTAKENLDKQFVFDNYVILHYDPKNDATDLTNTEKEEVKKREKDPIIFGLIAGSRRLYYVGDWVDEYCDLTLDVVVETLKERVNEVNNDKVKTYLDTGFRKDERIKIPNPYPHAVSASTYSYPITKFEKVKEVVNEVKEKTFDLVTRVILPKKRKGDVKPTKKSLKRTSSAEELKRVKKKNGKK